MIKLYKGYSIPFIINIYKEIIIRIYFPVFNYTKNKIVSL